MDYIGRLSDSVEEIYKAAEQAKHPSNVGALVGTEQRVVIGKIAITR